MAKTSLIDQVEAQAEVQRAPPQPVQGVRSPARLSAQVCHVPHLFPRERAHGLRPGRDQGLVVRGTTICPLTDPIADMLTRIRNANTANHQTVDVPASRAKKAIAQILHDEGFIESFERVSEGPQGTIRIQLELRSRKGKVITGLRRISRPGLRVYTSQDRDSARARRPWFGDHVNAARHHVGQARSQARRRRRGPCVHLVRWCGYVAHR